MDGSDRLGRAKSASPSSLRYRYAQNAHSPSASPSASSRRRAPPSPLHSESHPDHQQVASALQEMQAAKAALSSSQDLREREVARLQAVHSELSSIRERTAAIEGQRRAIEAATQATTCELQVATRELHAAMNVLGQEAEALHEADYRRARLLQRLQQFQELQSSLTEVVESSFTSAEPSPSNCHSADWSNESGDQMHEINNHFRQMGGAGVDTRSDRVPRVWEPLSVEEVRSCLTAYQRSGHSASTGIDATAAKQLAAKAVSPLTRLDLDQLVRLADLDGDGLLKPTEFCLMLYLLKEVRLGRSLPARITHAEAVHILRNSRDSLEPSSTGPPVLPPLSSRGGEAGRVATAHSRSRSADTSAAAIASTPSRPTSYVHRRPPAISVGCRGDHEGGEEDGGAGSGHVSEDSDAESFLPTPPGTSFHAGELPSPISGEQVYGWGPIPLTDMQSQSHSSQPSPMGRSAGDGGSARAAAGPSESAEWLDGVEELEEVRANVTWRAPRAGRAQQEGASTSKQVSVYSQRERESSSTGEGSQGRGSEVYRSFGSAPSHHSEPSTEQDWSSSESSGTCSPSPRDLTTSRRPVLPTLRILIDKVALDHSRNLERAYFSVSLRGANGAIQVPAQDTPEAVQRVNRYLIMQHAIDLSLSNVEDISDSAVFFELKYWKAKARKVSLRAWSAMPLEPLLQVGGPPSHVWEAVTGTLNLPLYAKPLDPVRRKCKRMNTKAFDLHVYISGVP